MATLSETDKDTPRQQEQRLSMDSKASVDEQMQPQDELDDSYRTFDEYMKMNGKPRLYSMQKGICLVINMTEKRPGTTKDVAAIEKVFKEMDFEVITQTDKKKKDIEKALKQVASRGNAYNSVVCFILSHGNENEMKAADSTVPFIALFEILKQSANLAGKPKIWFIQACRGHNIDEIHQDDFPYKENLTHKFPVEGDALYVFATAKGYVASRHKEYGTIFIQTLCEILADKTNRGKLFVSLLPHLNDFIASKIIPCEKTKEMLQVIEFYSTLRGDLYFDTQSMSH